MSPRQRVAIVLAAGKGTRMKSGLPKVLHGLLGKPMLQRALEALIPLGLSRVFVVIGHEAQQLETAIAGMNLPFPVNLVIQAPQLGTGHAVMQVLPMLPATEGVEVLITCGDMPLVPSHRYEALVDRHMESRAKVTMVSVRMPNPTGYGRVVSEGDRFVRIVEEKDASPEEKRIKAINAGIYLGHWPAIAGQLGRLSQNNAQGEYYLTDVLGLLVQSEGPDAVAVDMWPVPEEVMGINSREHLAEATRLLSEWTARRLMTDGVTLIQPHTMTLAPEVSIGPDTIMHPGCYLVGPVVIGSHGDIGPYTTMRGNIQVGNHCRVVQSYLDNRVIVADHCYVGPYAHLRDNAVVGQQCRLGNFVEVKETTLGNRSNAAHLCYLGDADIGDDVNMGAGSIIANYDPILDKKYRTAIADGVKVGCNSVLISPVTLEERSCVAAGSVITDRVAAWDLAIARTRQTALPQWVRRKQGLPVS